MYIVIFDKENITETNHSTLINAIFYSSGPDLGQVLINFTNKKVRSNGPISVLVCVSLWNNQKYIVISKKTSPKRTIRRESAPFFTRFRVWNGPVSYKKSMLQGPKNNCGALKSKKNAFKKNLRNSVFDIRDWKSNHFLS